MRINGKTILAGPAENYYRTKRGERTPQSFGGIRESRFRPLTVSPEVWRQRVKGTIGYRNRNPAVRA